MATLSQRQRDERRRLLNKAEILEIDLSYRAASSFDAYALIGKLKSALRELPETHPVYQETDYLIAAWNIKDEANWQLYNEKRQKVRREHYRKARSAAAARSDATPESDQP